ncbi:MAG TPA: helix-turn-helix domain-containing protein [Xanthobacteraceae bacterium]|nr:helix-turn-helix domain-containing protein [Xanthobacteraceae bacterium]
MTIHLNVREIVGGNSRPQFAAPEFKRAPIAELFDMMGAALSFGRNQEVYGEGEPAEYLYVVKSGCVRTSKSLNDGRRQIGAFYLPGDVFGLEAGEEHSFSAEALSTTTVRIVKRAALTSRIAGDAAMASHLLKLTTDELQRTQARILLLIKSAQERIAGFLLEMAKRSRAVNEIELPMCRQDIADYLGLTIETVSRTLTQLENSRAIELSTSRRIVLRNRPALARLNS